MTKRWGRPFEEPIEVDGRKLATPLNAGEYIAALPKKEHDVPEWQAAVEALLLVVERGDPTINPEGKSRIGGRKWKRDQRPSSFTPTSPSRSAIRTTSRCSPARMPRKHGS